MRTYLVFMSVVACAVLPQCGSKKQSHQEPQQIAGAQHDDALVAQQGEKVLEEPGLIGSFLRNIRKSQMCISNQSYPELRAKLKACQEAGDAYTALKYAEKMYTQCEEEAELIDLLLLCADLCCSQKNYKKASALYNEFVRLYPSVPEKTEHAWYHAIICSENQQTSTTDRDQTMTKETITLAESFLRRADFSIYREQVMAVLNRCQQRLVDHELGIVDFYMHRGSLQAAEKRLAFMRTEWIAKYAASEPLILIYECRLACAQHNVERAEAAMQELVAKFSSSLTPERMQEFASFKSLVEKASVVVAQGQSGPRSSFADRF